MNLRRWVKGFIWILLIGFVAIQFFPAPSNTEKVDTEADFITITKPPPDIEKLITSACYDCHSNRTEYPWYSKVQPVGWLLQDHIEEGKAELNFSEYGDYSGRRKRMKLKSSISQIEDGKMPLISYTILHPEARFSKEEKRALLDFLEKLHDRL